MEICVFLIESPLKIVGMKRLLLPDGWGPFSIAVRIRELEGVLDFYSSSTRNRVFCMKDGLTRRVDLTGATLQREGWVMGHSWEFWDEILKHYLV